MNPIRWSTNRWRLLAARLVVAPRRTLSVLMAVALAGCGGNIATEPDGGSAALSANAATVVAPASAAPEFVRVEVNYNFLTGESAWTSSGAFADVGFIGVAETVETFSPGTFKRAKVIGPIVASDGSTITWMFIKVWTFTSATTLVSKGQWHILSGTGRYAGIKGQGDLDGDLNLVTGAGKDVFTGWIHWP